MVFQKSKELIENYVKKHKDKKTSKNDIMYYITEKAVPSEYRISKKTAFNTIKEMGKDRLTISIPERKGQTHYVSINDKSEFHRIKQELASLKKLLNNLNDNVPEKLAAMKRVKTTTAIESHFRNLVHITQLMIYSVVTDLVSSIEKNIMSSGDKQVLYLSLWEALRTSNKLNGIMFPEVFSQIAHLFKEMETIKVVPNTRYYNIVMSVIDPVTEFLSSISKPPSLSLPNTPVK